MIIGLSCAADLPASRETLTSFSSSSFARVRKIHVNNWLRPVNFFYFIFLLKTKESASLAWLFLHTGRWPACIESVFYWICGSRIFSVETLNKTTGQLSLITVSMSWFFTIIRIFTTLLETADTLMMWWENKKNSTLTKIILQNRELTELIEDGMQKLSLQEKHMHQQTVELESKQTQMSQIVQLEGQVSQLNSKLKDLQQERQSQNIQYSTELQNLQEHL